MKHSKSGALVFICAAEVMVERLFLGVPRSCLWFVIVVFPDQTHLLFLKKTKQISAVLKRMKAKQSIKKKARVELLKIEKAYEGSLRYVLTHLTIQIINKQLSILPQGSLQGRQ